MFRSAARRLAAVTFLAAALVLAAIVIGTPADSARHHTLYRDHCPHNNAAAQHTLYRNHRPLSGRTAS